MPRYAQINMETGIVVSDSHLSGTVDRPELIPIPDDFELAGKRYAGGEWEDYIPEPVEEEPSEQDTINAEILLNQAMILSNQDAADEVLAAILLNQAGG
ncbi:hypothetical protein BRYFOR_07559 [Marvinbryantia formatexigens DSM 14469]|uniref:Uncharacterized protein n=1 Tax=Marvinbryantia formatexigens DSM 14469 TaxID=478749 RepID=C6LFZ9_9FIRM|nr:hypothetical protein [Marvinbryantia formatexigens]EET60363.1 hypothetical protein BRYFOR_07559 [Marvinbryantia formatexigens DSM 14469]UWO25297.1 flagellar basal-body rod protein [Marvinbryantia formatexigens DSM 14469]SDH41878.1 hypothetical protein SAMN05660368_04273 [Marvinbryantia formatexigens]